MTILSQLELFPDFGKRDDELLYVIGNGFDLHHEIDSTYWDFKVWVRNTLKKSSLVGMMDTFFSNDRDFWGDIENALGEYVEEDITDYCEPDNPEDFKYEHPGQWQDGVEGGIPWIFGQTMDEFRDAFNLWVRSIDISGIEADLHIPKSAKYLSFNYTETLEKAYGIPKENVLHIHGSRLQPGDVFVIGHGNFRDKDAPLRNEAILLPYQNAYSEVIRIMNEWKKDPDSIIKQNASFFNSLYDCKAVCVMGLSYNDIDMPYLKEVAASVHAGCKWILYYFSKKDEERAGLTAKTLGLTDYTLKKFE